MLIFVLCNKRYVKFKLFLHKLKGLAVNVFEDMNSPEYVFSDEKGNHRAMFFLRNMLTVAFVLPHCFDVLVPFVYYLTEQSTVLIGDVTKQLERIKPSTCRTVSHVFL